MTEKRKKKRQVVEAAKERIDNVEATKVNPSDIKITVPFALATKLNQVENLRKSQSIIRKQLCTYITNYFDDFVSNMEVIKREDNIIHARLFVEVLKLVIPRPKEYEEQSEIDERGNSIKRLFGV